MTKLVLTILKLLFVSCLLLYGMGIYNYYPYFNADGYEQVKSQYTQAQVEKFISLLFDLPKDQMAQQVPFMLHQTTEDGSLYFSYLTPDSSYFNVIAFDATLGMQTKRFTVQHIDLENPVNTKFIDTSYTIDIKPMGRIDAGIYTSPKRMRTFVDGKMGNRSDQTYFQKDRDTIITKTLELILLTARQE